MENPAPDTVQAQQPSASPQPAPVDLPQQPAAVPMESRPSSRSNDPMTDKLLRVVGILLVIVIISIIGYLGYLFTTKGTISFGTSYFNTWTSEDGGRYYYVGTKAKKDAASGALMPNGGMATDGERTGGEMSNVVGLPLPVQWFMFRDVETLLYKARDTILPSLQCSPSIMDWPIVRTDNMRIYSLDSLECVSQNMTEPDIQRIKQYLSENGLFDLMGELLGEGERYWVYQAGNRVCEVNARTAYAKFAPRTPDGPEDGVFLRVECGVFIDER